MEKVGVAASSIIGHPYQHMEPILTGEGCRGAGQLELSLGGDEGVPYLSRADRKGKSRLSAVWKPTPLAVAIRSRRDTP
jgi:hypothetical protein